MLSVQGRSTRLRGRITRRELMRVGGLSLFGGMVVSRLLEASGEDGHRPRAAERDR